MILIENGFLGKYSIVFDISIFDLDYDGYVDRLYVVDIGGDIWCVDMFLNNFNDL